MLDQLRMARPRLARPSWSFRVFADYLALTKPPIILLLLVTAVGGMFLAANGSPAVATVLLVCAGGALGAGGANALNHYLDRDIDEVMSRTRRRPVPGRRIPPYGLSYSASCLTRPPLESWPLGQPAGGGADAVGNAVLRAGLHGWLKRSSPQNIVIGGAAGSIPPVVGWAAVTGGLDLPALYLFCIVFFWTPPHFWALALLIQKDYEEARIPMLPVVAGRAQTVSQILVYSVVLVALSLLLAATPEAGWVYLGSAAALGAVFIAMALQLKLNPETVQAKKLYLYSLLYLALLFAAMAVDSALTLG